MKIGFDLDGVLREEREGFFHLLHSLKIPQEERNRLYRLENDSNCKPLLNPIEFASRDDTLHCISYCHDVHTVFDKSAWVKHWYGDRVSFFGIIKDKSFDEKGNFVEAVANAKAQRICDEGIEVFFENNPEIVKLLREMLPNYIKIIQYGMWID